MTDTCTLSISSYMYMYNIFLRHLLPTMFGLYMNDIQNLFHNLLKALHVFEFDIIKSTYMHKILKENHLSNYMILNKAIHAKTIFFHAKEK